MGGLIRRWALLVAGFAAAEGWACTRSASTGQGDDASAPDATAAGAAAEAGLAAEAAAPDGDVDSSADALAQAPADGSDGEADAEGDGAIDPTAAFCAAVAAHVAHCTSAVDGSTACSADIANCGAVSFVLSDGAREAYAGCGNDLGCGSTYDFLDDVCFQNGLAHVPLDAEQTRLAADYCAACPEDSGTACEANFYALTANGAAGAGFYVRALNDTLVQVTRNLCLPIPGDPAANTCADRFDYCVSVRVLPDTPQYSCDGG
jgi:hypothetical protein